MSCTLQFRIESKVQDFGGYNDEVLGQVRSARIVPIVDGQELNMYFFDVVLAWSLRQADLPGEALKAYLFTCDCGDAGCAGIDCPVHIEIRDTTVCWKFPNKFEYKSKLSANGVRLIANERWCCTFEFDKVQYFNALDKVRADIVELEKKSPQYSVVLFEGYLCNELPPPIEQTLQEQDNIYKVWREKKRQEALLYGPLRQMLVKAHISEPSHAKFEILVRDLLDILSAYAFEHEEPMSPSKERAWKKRWIKNITRTLDEQTCLQLARSVSFEQLADRGYCSGAENCRSILQERWPNVPLSIMPED